MTSGYLPLGGVVSGRVAEPFWSEPGRVTVRHGQTYAGHAAACAAALANIGILEGEGLIPRAQELEDDLLGALAPLGAHPLVGGVRGGVGLMAAIDDEVLERDRAVPVNIAKAGGRTASSCARWRKRSRSRLRSSVAPTRSA